ncbi:MAG: hypothetical protein IPP17_14020 [Bacteroidetes bacterium]|nr:hypothetical protein [Bacteroidota bacterium]
MITYPELGLPEAWKPLFKAMADAGWELEAALGPQEQLDCRDVLQFSGYGRKCWLCLLVEPEWCGNNLQSGGLTVVGLSEELPGNRSTAEEHALLLSGAWEEEVNGFVDDFFAKTRQKYGVDC